MDAIWLTLMGIAGTLLGGLLGHVYAMRGQQQQWRREDVRRREERQHAPRIDFEVDVRFVRQHRDGWIVELIALLDNKGSVQYRTSLLTFELRILRDSDQLTAGDEAIGRQITIPHVVADGSWLPQSWSGTIIEPGTAARYSHVTTVPRDSCVVLLHGRVDYVSDVDVTHTAQALVPVPPSS